MASEDLLPDRNRRARCPNCGEIGVVVVRSRTHTETKFYQMLHDRNTYCYYGKKLPVIVAEQLRKGEIFDFEVPRKSPKEDKGKQSELSDFS